MENKYKMARQSRFYWPYRRSLLPSHTSYKQRLARKIKLIVPFVPWTGSSWQSASRRTPSNSRHLGNPMVSGANPFIGRETLSRNLKKASSRVAFSIRIPDNLSFVSRSVSLERVLLLRAAFCFSVCWKMSPVIIVCKFVGCAVSMAYLQVLLEY